MSIQQPPEPCHLCGANRPLQESHIIPNWVYRDEIRGQGGKLIDLAAMRTHSRAFTMRLLCEECENRFSKWENPAKQFGAQSMAGASYGDWLFSFATSISWRVLKYHLQHPSSALSDWLRSVLSETYIQDALDAWGTHLRSGVLIARSALHRQHMFMVSPTYEARRVIIMQIASAEGHTFVFSRFSFYAILGILRSDNPHELRSSEIQPCGGALPNENRMPLALAQYQFGLEKEARNRARRFVNGQDSDDCPQVIL